MDRASVLDLFQLGNTPDFFHSALQSLGCMCCAPNRSKQYFTQHAGLTQWRSPRYEVPFVYGYIYIYRLLTCQNGFNPIQLLFKSENIARS